MKTNFGMKEFAEWAEEGSAERPAHWAGLYAMYSSLWDAVTTDPRLMVVPLDDHMVHRGDGVFETCRVDGGGVYRFGAHWARLERGAEAIGLRLRWGFGDVVEVSREVLRAGGRKDALLRIFVSRGPGGHGAGPKECAQAQLYVAAVRMGKGFMEAHPEGACVGVSRVPAKPGVFARVKSVNYLPNALMKAEADANGWDFAVGVDGEGCLTESATENWAALLKDGTLVAPREERVLAGTTMGRVWELAGAELAKAGGGRLEGLVSGLARRGVTVGEARRAREMYILGTTPAVTAVTRFDGAPVGDGKPGAAWRALAGLLAEDMRDPAQRTWLG
jgi:branched-chain amino acid aminotransferase